MKNQVCVVIVNYRISRLVFDCLASLAHEVEAGLQKITVIVVDNDSGDDSVAFLADAIDTHKWSNWVTILSLSKNGGFAYGNNQAIATLLDSSDSPEYFWLLNPDTVVHGGACSELIRFMEAHPNVGIAGSRLEGPDGTLQVSAFRDHTVVSEFLSGARLGVANSLLSRWVVPQAKAYSEPVKVDWVSGASFMVRKSVFEQVGLLDEAYFMYYEEVDFCIRARKAGWECWHVPASRVVHLVGASSGITDNGKKAKRRPTYWFESRRRFFLKNHNGFTLLLADFLWMAGYITLIIRRKVQQKQNLDPPCFLPDFFINSAFVKGMWMK